MIDRFLAKVSPEPNSGCWLWCGYIDRGGYGLFSEYGRPKKAHRVAYRLFVGPLSDGLDVHHQCATRCCVNPSHLEQIDGRVHDVMSGSERPVTFKVSPQLAQDIREEYARGELTMRELASQYRIGSHTTVLRIIRNARFIDREARNGD